MSYVLNLSSYKLILKRIYNSPSRDTTFLLSIHPTHTLLYCKLYTVRTQAAKPRIPRKVLHRSNQMYELKHFGMVWQRRTREKCCGAQRKPYF
jgi:hypothetical protein